jgi:hypothetical protein
MQAQIFRPPTCRLDLDDLNNVKVISTMRIDSLIPIMARLWDVTLKPQILSIEVRCFMLELTNAHHNGGYGACLANICERAEVRSTFFERMHPILPYIF